MLCFKHPIVFDDNINLRKLAKEGQLKKKKKEISLRKLQEESEFLKTNTSAVKRLKRESTIHWKIWRTYTGSVHLLITHNNLWCSTYGFMIIYLQWPNMATLTPFSAKFTCYMGLDECTVMFMKKMLNLSNAFGTKNVTNTDAYSANINENHRNIWQHWNLLKCFPKPNVIIS